jgi:hypothetical protein
MLGDPTFLRDFTEVGERAAAIMSQLFTALTHVVSGLRNVMIAGGPFIRWLSETILGWAKMFDEASNVARFSGHMSRTFARWREDLTRLGHILANVWGTLRNIGKAARPLGEDLYRSAERTSAAWERMTGTSGGQLKLIRGFLVMRESIRQVNLILGDMTRGLFRAGQNQTLPNTLRRLRRLLQDLGELLQRMADHYGPMLVDLFRQLARTIGVLVAPNGAFTIFVKLLTRALELFNQLIEAIPGFSGLLATAFSVFAFTRIISKVMQLGKAWLFVGAAQATAAGAGGAATGAMGGGLLGFLGGRSVGGMVGARELAVQRLVAGSLVLSAAGEPFSLVLRVWVRSLRCRVRACRRRSSRRSRSGSVRGLERRSLRPFCLRSVQLSSKLRRRSGLRSWGRWWEESAGRSFRAQARACSAGLVDYSVLPGRGSGGLVGYRVRF